MNLNTISQQQGFRKLEEDSHTTTDATHNTAETSHDSSASAHDDTSTSDHSTSSHDTSTTDSHHTTSSDSHNTTTSDSHDSSSTDSHDSSTADSHISPNDHSSESTHTASKEFTSGSLIGKIDLELGHDDNLKVETDDHGSVVMEYHAKDSSKIQMTAKENIITITYTDVIGKIYTHTSHGESFTLMGLE